MVSHWLPAAAASRREETTMNTKRLFRNRKTEANIEALACLAFHYDKRGETGIGLDLLKAAGISPESATFCPTTRKLIKTYVDRMMKVGFLTLLDKGYKPGVRSRKFRVNKEAVLSRYGEATVYGYKSRLEPNDSPEKFVERVESIGLQPDGSVSWEVTAPGRIEFRRGGKKLNALAYRGLYGRQLFQMRSFHGQKDAVADFVRSLPRESLPGDVAEMIERLNDGEKDEFKKDFSIRLSTWLTASKKSLIVRKSTRSYSQFCSYKKATGDRQRALDREGLTREFDIKSAVPRITSLLNKGAWLDNSVDLYETIFKAAGIEREWDEALRESVKDVFMRMYFVESPRQSWNFYRMAKGEKAFNRREYLRLFDAVRSVVGKPLGGEIFLWESILETQVAYRLKELGHRILNVYDGFYFRDDLSVEEVEKCVAKAAECLARRKAAKEGTIAQSMGDSPLGMAA